MASITAASLSLLTTRWATQLPGVKNIAGSTDLDMRFGLRRERRLIARSYTSPKACTSDRSVSAKATAVPSTGITGIIDAPSPPVRGANLGAWLVTEGWMTPWLFDGILNKDLLDGTKVYFTSVVQGKYLTAENGTVFATRTAPVKPADPYGQNNETITFWRVSPTTFQFKSTEGQFIGLDGQGVAVANVASPSKEHTFEIILNGDDKSRVRIRAPNGRFLQAKADGSVVADYCQESTVWGDDDPSVFTMTVNSVMDGEFQLVNGLGKEKAEQVMRNHWDTYIVENDFKFMAENGINAVRVPVGYWITYGDNPPWPFVGGSLAALDNTFNWGEKHGIRIIVDLHAVPGAATSVGHSGTRDGSVGWGTQETIDKTIEAIDFLALRYAKKPNLLGIQVINEPLGFSVSVETLSNYYRRAHETIRKHCPSCYVILPQRLFGETTEFVQVASSLDRAVIDDHYYHVNYPQFLGLTAQQNIDYINNERAHEMNLINETNGRPLLFIGEWTGQWPVKGGTEEEHKQFIQAQVDLYSRATFGWSYWSFKCIKNYWSMEWLLKNGYLTIPVLEESKA